MPAVKTYTSPQLVRLGNWKQLTRTLILGSGPGYGQDPGIIVLPGPIGNRNH